MLDRARPLAFGWVLAALCAGASAQTALREWKGATKGDACGAGFANCGDLDQDGIDDFAIGMPGDDTIGADRGKVVLVSGADGQVIRTYFASHYDKRLGTSVHVLGDIDLDGTVDLLVGAQPATAVSAYATHFKAISGADGAVLWIYTSPTSLGNDTLPVIAVVGDTNLDGRADVAIAFPAIGSPQYSGVIVVVSGLNGSVLAQVTNPVQYASIGTGLSAAGDLDGDGRCDWWNTRNENLFNNFAQLRSGLDAHVLYEIALPYYYESDVPVHLVGGNDVDGDGVPDLVAAIPVSPGYGLYGPGHIHAYSGATHAQLWSRAGVSNAKRIGWWLADIGDVDHDGVRDLATSEGGGQPNSYGIDPNALVLSGANGAPISGFALPVNDQGFAVVLPAGDVDGDGQADVAYSAMRITYTGSIPAYTAGAARVVSLSRAGLSADRFELDHLAGGTQTFTVDFGPAHAGHTYRVLGSMSGTQPGLVVDTKTIPLALDPYLIRTLRNPGDAHLTSASGVLDAQGRAVAMFTLPAGSMRFPRDTVVHHAAVVMDASGTHVAAISRAVPVLVTVDPCHADAFAVDDCDGDGMRDGCQVNNTPGIDCNGNARPDTCDITFDFSIDCDGDGVPDECQEDCNHNRRRDVCDIASGESADCDLDGLPDECTPYGADMNQNHVPDVCESVTRYVDDDALLDPAPGSPSISDPLEDGSAAHPFDSLSEAVLASGARDEIVIEDGLYTGPQNRDVSAVGHVSRIRSRNGPDACHFDLEFLGGLIRSAGGPAGTGFHLEGITIVHSTAVVYPSNQATVITSGGDVVVRNCRFMDGRGSGNSGLSVQLSPGHTSLIEHCVFTGNINTGTAPDLGSALQIFGSGGQCLVRNCLFAGNGSTTSLNWGQAVSITANTTIDHCTFSVPTMGATVAVRVGYNGAPPATAVIKNSILHGLTAAAPVAKLGSVSIAMEYCTVSCPLTALTPAAALGAGLLQADPQFVHLQGGDLHIVSGSPCRNAGDPSFAAGAHERDGDGEPRVMNGRTDIGWDERP